MKVISQAVIRFIAVNPRGRPYSWQDFFYILYFWLKKNIWERQEWREECLWELLISVAWWWLVSWLWCRTNTQCSSIMNTTTTYHSTNTGRPGIHKQNYKSSFYYLDLPPAQETSAHSLGLLFNLFLITSALMIKRWLIIFLLLFNTLQT